MVVLKGLIFFFILICTDIACWYEMAYYYVNFNLVHDPLNLNLATN